ncbi:DedA family protein [Kribbella solani]|uniref:Membrane protein DedA with SNARE-associated domain n=1 Tax=Kribbella solani TaxID=236067 RepID=A0A841E377_9ACTN|nr:VTT domain-containing protein [Kribbella solani]MBB5983496.1 membrane protein DedA with SNARE-associated domain [Kribbella solani]MDX2971508.1 DedA family protein [Kribbella solani]MDX3002768.1 DedA family protein [Kribbella solani]
MTELMEVARHLLGIAMASHWLLLILFAAAALDAVFPVVPSEGMVITAGMAAAAGHQNLLLVIAVAMAGSVIGESACYFLGRGSGPVLHRWMRRQERRQQLYDKVATALHARGGLILMTVRYIPGARMVATLTAGATRYSFKKFLVFTFFGVTIAYTYVALLGYLGGDAFAHDQLKGLAFSLGLAAVIGLVIETARRIAVKRRAAKLPAA